MWRTRFVSLHVLSPLALPVGFFLSAKTTRSTTYIYLSLEETPGENPAVSFA
jgi:hypothetical protein